MINRKFILLIYFIYILIGVVIVSVGIKNIELQPILTKLFYIYIIVGPICGVYVGRVKRDNSKK